LHIHSPLHHSLVTYWRTLPNRRQTLRLACLYLDCPLRHRTKLARPIRQQLNLRRLRRPLHGELDPRVRRTAANHRQPVVTFLGALHSLTAVLRTSQRRNERRLPHRADQRQLLHTRLRRVVLTTISSCRVLVFLMNLRRLNHP
jgi:hypothetical protein